MNIDNYKFYIRDIGITDTDLTNVLNDVIKDIALKTRIFKKAFGFTIEPDMYDYNFRGLLEVYERTQEQTIDSLIINSYTEDQLLNYLSNPLDIEVSVTNSASYGVPSSTYIDTIDVLTKVDDVDQLELSSIFYLFEPIDGDSFKFVSKIQYPVEALCLVHIIPNIKSIDDRVETYLKSTIIAGLKYYTDTEQSQQNVNTDINSYKKYQNALLELQSNFPTIVTQQIKGSPV